MDSFANPDRGGEDVNGATAAVVDEPVLARNVEDFERIDVGVETY